MVGFYDFYSMAMADGDGSTVMPQTQTNSNIAEIQFNLILKKFNISALFRH
jgi:hypothetical protein